MNISNVQRNEEYLNKRFMPLIDMFFYTDSENVRFCVWIKARPGISKGDNFWEILKTVERIDETNFDKFEKLQKVWGY